MEQVLRGDQNFNSRCLSFEISIRHLSRRQLGIGIWSSEEMIELDFFK